ncbi:hypothetical protein Dxin01_03993 [Deinococcus xinjiangensis]|uniref:Uncharacterized protein n=1 Tax=Deinococcus xinjiangensis TaxID=457454 RepID=A0ABP9VG82_9DEIO
MPEAMTIAGAIKEVKKHLTLIEGELFSMPNGAIKVNLSDFLDLLLVGDKTAFYEIRQLSEDDFPNISQAEIMVILEGFRQWLGQPRSVAFYAPYKSTLIYSIVDEIWYEDFTKHRDTAKELAKSS